MEVKFRYRGRSLTEADIVCIRDLIAAHPGASRRALSEKLCEAWNWRQQNGRLCDMVCRGLMLKLHRSAMIELPQVRQKNPNPLARRGAERQRPHPVLIDTTELSSALSELQPLEFRQVRHSGEESFFNSLIEHYHYLGYRQPVGEHLKYLVFAHQRPIAALAWSSAPRHLGPRDRFIGWSAVARRQNIGKIAYNTRFLILPFVKVPHLASHILGAMARRLSVDWEQLYGHPIYFLETFIDPERFGGISYRAANWFFLGLTTGRGKDDWTHKANRPLKEVLGYPLVKRFRQRLSQSR